MDKELLIGDFGARHNEFEDLMQSLQVIDNALHTAHHELGRIYRMRDDIYYMFTHEPENK